MSNTDNPTNDEEQLATVPTDYRGLLAMTRPLVIAEQPLASWRGGEICRSGFGIPLVPATRGVESTLKRGEIVHFDKSALGITGDQGEATASEEAGASSAPEVEHAVARLISHTPQADSRLGIRIYLGMS